MSSQPGRETGHRLPLGSGTAVASMPRELSLQHGRPELAANEQFAPLVKAEKCEVRCWNAGRKALSATAEPSPRRRRRRVQQRTERCGNLRLGSGTGKGRSPDRGSGNGRRKRPRPRKQNRPRKRPRPRREAEWAEKEEDAETGLPRRRGRRKKTGEKETQNRDRRMKKPARAFTAVGGSFRRQKRRRIPRTTSRTGIRPASTESRKSYPPTSKPRGSG